MKKIVTKQHTPITRWPLLDQSDEDAVLGVLREGNITTAKIIQDLEDGYKNYIGRNYALAHNNGTAGLMAAFHSLGLQPGDEVLVPTATFWASVLPMIWFGLVPVFCESESETLGIDPKDMLKKIGPRTKAVVVVHLWGLPCKIKEIKSVAEQHNLKIIEDASHAHGASWNGVACGALGDVSVMSLQGEKLAPAGEGGMLLTDDYDIYEKAICLGDITRIIELETAQRRFAATSFGIKTRIAPLSAAIGLNQLKKLKENNQQRQRNHLYLSEKLEALGFYCFIPAENIQRVYFEFIIRYREVEPDGLLEKLQAMGCHVSRPRYPLLHEQPFFTEGKYKEIGRYPEGCGEIERVINSDFAKTAMENQRLIKLPNFCGSDNGILDQYIETFEVAIK
ncbi:DegT/DnrJ/EryC1/StrS family aminotransferase [Spartinivicinus poritis]|uniref:DegT/DnrJ/EryC1/StrS family aminotransferase n=1 Tax=Spartinivicinus poritis TaxID=2994640 RepID=A0ABT5UE78_9GAMM|nr:DegT/DnrJ/EryC1/StrS family aminotransferase [Spartinivicinus sp. A2-2]MDE1464311.1 DegT/DnrJ/EryC1/StrS family aminotransferase [Spartinivicinus sp. A2-2]